MRERQVDLRHHRRTLADRRDPLGGTRAHVADREDVGQTRLQRQDRPGGGAFSRSPASGEHEAPGVSRDAVIELIAIGVGAHEQEQMPQRPVADRPVGAAAEDRAGQPVARIAVERDELMILVQLDIGQSGDPVYQVALHGRDQRPAGDEVQALYMLGQEDHRLPRRVAATDQRSPPRRTGAPRRASPNRRLRRLRNTPSPAAPDAGNARRSRSRRCARGPSARRRA